MIVHPNAEIWKIFGRGDHHGSRLPSPAVATGGLAGIHPGQQPLREMPGGGGELHLLDAIANVAGNQAFNFIGTQAFSGSAGQLHYAPSGANTLISGDVNGDRTADFSILLNGAHALTATDFVL